MLSLRIGSILVSVVLARLLTPAEFGVYAVALAVQAVLMPLADLGLSADLVRSADPGPREGTVATLSLTSGTVLTALMVATSAPLAGLMGSAESAATIAVFSGTILLASIGVVPLARLQRDIRQRTLFGIAVADFVISTLVTIGLVLLGWGPMALAVGRVSAQTVAMTLQFRLARVRPHFGFDRAVARSVLGFGVPVAGANLLSWALLSIDRVVLSRTRGAAALGLYVMAFNVSSWPMSAIGQAVRGVALPAYARVEAGRESRVLADSLGLVWSVGVFGGAIISALAAPIIGFLYGEKWVGAVPVLAVLGILGAVRVIIDTLNTFLFARGDSRSVLILQAIWFAALLIALPLGAFWAGAPGLAWAHVVVAAGVVVPLTLRACRGSGVRVRDAVVAMTPPLLAAGLVFGVAAAVAAAIESQFLTLVAGGLAGTAAYGAVLFRWFRTRIRGLSTATGSEGGQALTDPDTGLKGEGQ